MKKPQAKPTARAASPANDLEWVAALARIAGEHDLAEVEIERGDMRVRVARGSVAHPATVFHSPPPAVAAPAPTAPVEAPVGGDVPGTVKSPMVGTAYLRPSPESKPFIDIGQSVKEGDKVLLVEAMKTFNEILAPRSGVVTHIFVADGTPVEFGQPLLAIS